MLVGAVALGANAKGSCDVAGTVYSVDTTFMLTSDRVPHKPQCCYKVATSTCVCSTPQWI